ncbi:MAG: hypothetical protein IPK83_12180 [Planctomycetes bacterium]|nr:hypothetical protein [Planctomycetota bacterium]
MSLSTNHKQPGSRMVRFVVLFHEQEAGNHFDLMIENEETLATWKLPQAPETAVGTEVACLRIAEHRRIYLEYEGPISGDRGQVTRHDQGDCSLEECNDRLWSGQFIGNKLRGRFELRGNDGTGENWSLHLFRE